MELVNCVIQDIHQISWEFVINAQQIVQIVQSIKLEMLQHVLLVMINITCYLEPQQQMLHVSLVIQALDHQDKVNGLDVLVQMIHHQ